MGRESFHAALQPVGEDVFRKAATEVRLSGDLGRLPAGWLECHANLIAPVREKIRSELVGIIPHGPLHYIPFAALTDGKVAPGKCGPVYVCDELALFYLPSASVCPVLRRPRTASRGGVLALAQGHVAGSSRLEEADAEAADVARIYGTAPVPSQRATELIFRKQAGSSHIVHIAAHGRFDSVQPLFSHIVLGEQSDANDPSNDGVLALYEVFDIDLRSTDLVVLSACDTQVGRRSQGDDMVGLGRAFLRAGAGSVVASLWRVDDAAARRAMRAFHMNLRRGMSKAAALQKAQVETRREYPALSAWAPFVLTG